MHSIVYIATSLDGFIADESGGLDWLNNIPNPENSDYGWQEFNNRIDAILMGRGTFETVVAFGDWPYQKPVHVLSTSLTAVPERLAKKVKLHHGSPVSILTELENEGVKNLYVDGGRLIQSLLREDLVDEIILTRVPVLLGGGIPLFKDTGAAKAFTHVGTVALNATLTKSTYRRNRG